MTWTGFCRSGEATISPKDATQNEPQKITEGLSSFTYTDPPEVGGTSLLVWTFRPQGWTEDDRLLFILHGMTRNGKAYLEDWEETARRNRWMLTAPIFAEDDYPGSTTYNLGNIFGTALLASHDIRDWDALLRHLREASQAPEGSAGGRIWGFLPDSARDAIPPAADASSLAINAKSVILLGLNEVVQNVSFYDNAVFEAYPLPQAWQQALADGTAREAGVAWRINRRVLHLLYPDALNDADLRLNPRREWAFAVLERVFDELRQRTGMKRNDYLLYGHSAGAQFVHRMVIFQQENRVEAAVAANAGRYTLPDFGQAFSYGLGGVPYTTAALDRAMRRPMAILVGEQDVTGVNLSMSPRSMEQGENRLERAHTFWLVAREAAKKRDVKLAWQLRVVEGAGHQNAQMVGEAAQALQEMTQATP